MSMVRFEYVRVAMLHGSIGIVRNDELLYWAMQP